jgi:hypothetical protein
MKSLFHSSFIFRQLGPAFLLAVVAFPATCAAADQTKIVKWQEEVKLSTGEVIVVERETRFKGGGDPFQGVADLMTIRFHYPPGAKDVIEWRTVRYGDRGYFPPGKSIGLDLGPGKIAPNIRGYSPETPLLLDVERETKRLILVTRNAGTSEGCDEYFRYRYENGQWKDDMLPEVFEKRPSNLWLGSKEIDTPAQITLDFKRKFEADYHRWTRYDIRFRQVGPDRCLCGHIGNPVKSGCAQKYESIKE